MTEEAKVEEVKAEETKTTPPEELAEADLKAVEEVKGRLQFFFSDANVRQDHFIRKLLLRESNNVEIDSLLRFNTIKRHTIKRSVVVKAAKELSDTLTLDEKETAIGRVAPFTEEMMNGNVPKSLFVKNLPLKDVENGPKQYAVSMDDIRQQFEKYGEVVMVKLKWSAPDDDFSEKRKPKRRKFAAGSAMIEFSEKESLDKAAEATLTTKGGEKVEPKEKVVMGESKNELDVMMLEEYIEMRKKEKEAEEKLNGGSRKRDRDEKKKDVEDNKEPITINFNIDWKPGCVIQLKGLPESCDREGILVAIAAALEITVDEVKNRKIYADYSRGQPNGAVRFQEPADHIGEMVKKLNEGNLEVSGSKIEGARVLEGDEEKKYWEDFIQFKKKQIQHREEEKRARKKQKRY